MASFDEKTRPSEGPGLPFRPSSEFLPGQIINERYQIVAKLGQGGMGLVYKVKQVLLDKEFALKTIEQHAISPTALRRFQQEARAAFALDHPNIIAVKEFVILENQTPFLVMELVNGETLADRILRSAPIPWEQAIPIFVQICFGLAYAHECGIVHRDIKPGNIMLLRGVPEGTDGSIKILDFGIAKLMAHKGGEIQALTRTGEIFGSPIYMSPEQCSGVYVDNRADIYSLGCVFYEMLTGAPPCVGENALSTMMKHLNDVPMSLKQASMGAEFPKGLEDVVATMLAKSPDKRYQSLGKVANDLGATKRGATVYAPTESPLKKQTDLISMPATSFALILVGVILLTVLGTELVHSAMLKPAKTSNETLAPVQAISELEFPDKPSLIQTGPITSTIVKIHGQDRRQFHFGGDDFGFISNWNVYNKGPGRTLYQNFRTIPQTTLPFPVNEHLTLEIGGNAWHAIGNPVNFERIGKNEFYGLVITAHKVGDDLVPLTPEDLKNVESILQITKSWKNLEFIRFQNFPISETMAKALNQLPHLRIFSLITFSNEAELVLSKQPLLKRLKFLQLSSTQKPAFADDIFKALSGSSVINSIYLGNIALSQNSLEHLRECVNLRVLWLDDCKLDNVTLKAMADIKSLRYVLWLGENMITKSQLEWLTSRREDLRFKPTFGKEDRD